MYFFFRKKKKKKNYDVSMFIKDLFIIVTEFVDIRLNYSSKLTTYFTRTYVVELLSKINSIEYSFRDLITSRQKKKKKWIENEK